VTGDQRCGRSHIVTTNIVLAAAGSTDFYVRGWADGWIEKKHGISKLVCGKTAFSVMVVSCPIKARCSGRLPAR